MKANMEDNMETRVIWWFAGSTASTNLRSCFGGLSIIRSMLFGVHVAPPRVESTDV